MPLVVSRCILDPTLAILPTHGQSQRYLLDTTNHCISLKMTRLLAASLLVALVAILSTAPIDAAGESVLANDPVRGQETFLERRLKVCGGNALRARLATRIDIDVVGCLAPCPGGVVSKHTAVLFSRRAPFLDSHQFVSFPFCLETHTNPCPSRAPSRRR